MARKDPTPELLDQHPHLVPWPAKPKMSQAALAATNLRAELKKAFPGVKFSVKSENYSGGSSIHAESHVFRADGHTDEDLRQMNKQGGRLGEQFCYGTFDGMTDSYDYKSDPELRAFQDAFGSAKHVFVQIRMAPENVEANELARRAEAKKKKLEKTLPKGWEKRGEMDGPKI